jgi:exodeoxyribonuclease VII large subunit
MDATVASQGSAKAPDDRRPIRAKFKGTCFTCRRSVAEREDIYYEPATRRVFCRPRCPGARLAAEVADSVAVEPAPAEAATDVAPTDVPPNVLGLADLVGSIREAVAARFPAQVWVRAEILKLTRKASGFVFLELAESDSTGRVVAQIQASIHVKDRSRIDATFQSANGKALAVGMTIVAAVSVTIDRFGTSLAIHDVDPTYSAGALALALRQAAERLRAEGLFDRNCSLPSPEDFSTVAVIAPENARGLDDFRAEADALADAGLCAFVYRTARFSGDEAAGALVRALEGVALESEAAGFDAVVLVRGGGPAADLISLDHEEVARRVAKMPIPVFTAVGHESDRTLVDAVASRAFGTPSKAIAHIRSTIVDNALRAERAWTELNDRAAEDLARRRAGVDALRAQLGAFGREQRASAERETALAAAREAWASQGLPYLVVLPVVVAAVLAILLAALGRPLAALVAGAAGTGLSYLLYKRSLRGAL